MTIYVEDLKFQCIIGILDFERVTPQDIIINLSLKYKFKDDFINYAEIAELIESQMKKKKFLLIEDALKSISKSLKKEFQQIKKIDLKITKPSILPNCKVSVSQKYKFKS